MSVTEHVGASCIQPYHPTPPHPTPRRAHATRQHTHKLRAKGRNQLLSHHTCLWLMADATWQVAHNGRESTTLSPAVVHHVPQHLHDRRMPLDEAHRPNIHQLLMWRRVGLRKVCAFVAWLMIMLHLALRL